MSSHRLGACPHCRGWGQPAQSHPALAGNWNSVNLEALLLFHPVPAFVLSLGAHGARKSLNSLTELLSTSFFSLIPTPCPFQGLFSTSWGFHLPRFWHAALLSSPAWWPSFPNDLMRSLGSLGPPCSPASVGMGKPPSPQEYTVPLCPCSHALFLMP